MENPELLGITVITVCRNSEQFLQETIESVVTQTYNNIQYIIIDGNSTDGTLEIIKKYDQEIDTWLSEPDTGMYDAINKGLRLATGDYILILNSDDVLVSNNTIQEVANQIIAERLDYYYGNIIKSKDGKLKKVKLFGVDYQELLLSTHGTFVHHPCFFISKELNKILGGYDLKYRYASDYDYILRALSKSNRGKYLDIYISKFRLHANTISASGKIEAERIKILLEHGYYEQPFFKRKFYYYVLWIYYKLINLGKRYKTT